jgi:excisionase family DNA binding protein
MTDDQTTGPGAIPEPVAVRIAVAARMLGLGRTKLYELMDNQELVSLKVGRARLIVVASLHAFVRNQSQTGGE